MSLTEFDGKSWNLDTKVPPFRREVHFHPFKHEGEQWLYVHDSLGYAAPNCLIHPIGRLISPMMDGRKSVRQIYKSLQEWDGIELSQIPINELLKFVIQLDRDRLLESSYFSAYKSFFEEQFEAAEVRPPVCAGTSYPSEENAIRKQIELHPPSSTPVESTRIKAIFAPHIDPRVCNGSYEKAFAPLRKRPFKRVVFLATSHYAGLFGELYENKPFILSKKTFQTPLGQVVTDKTWVQNLSVLPGVSLHDRAHRMEHSIELHLLYLQLVAQQEFSIVPILVGSLDDVLYMPKGGLWKYVSRFAESLWQMVQEDEDTIVCISGDLAHVGRKFGDRTPASALAEERKAFDSLFLKQAEALDKEALLETIAQVNDKYRICGFPPLFTFLSAAQGLTGKTSDYAYWDEQETQSGVSFGAIHYYTNQISIL